jgi:microcystin degradation protein MlrC
VQPVTATVEIPALAERAALQLAGDFWAVHERLQAELTSLPAAVKIAQETEGTVALFDPADATSSGASGDSNAVLRALMEAAYTKRALTPIVDAPAVQAAFDAGIGSTIRTSVGGTLDPERFEPQVKRFWRG